MEKTLHCAELLTPRSPSGTSLTPPAQKDRRHRFGAAMKGVATFQPMEVTIKGNTGTPFNVYISKCSENLLLHLQVSTGAL